MLLRDEKKEEVTVVLLSSQVGVYWVERELMIWWLVPFPPVLQLLWAVRALSSPQLQHKSMMLEKNLEI